MYRVLSNITVVGLYSNILLLVVFLIIGDSIYIVDREYGRDFDLL